MCSMGWCVGPSSPTPMRVVGEDVDDRDFHERGQADRRAAEVGEDEEAGAVGADLRQGHAVEARAHGELADAEVDVAAFPAQRAWAVLVDDCRRRGRSRRRGWPSARAWSCRRHRTPGRGA